MPLNVIRQRGMSHIVGDEVKGLSRVKVNVVFSVHCLIVHLGGFRWRVLLYFTGGKEKKKVTDVVTLQ